MQACATQVIRPRHVASALAVCALLSSAEGLPQAHMWRPEQPVEIVVGVGPGGSVDVTARLVQKLWQEKKVINSPVSVINKLGGGGAVGFAYLNQHRGNAHYIMLTAIPFLTNNITGRSPIHYSEFTPITRLSSDYVLFTVRADSPITTGAELLERWRQDPASVSVAVGIGLGTANHIASGLAIKATGAEPKKGRYVVFKSSAESFTALLGGHVDVVAASPASSMGQLTAKRIRPLAINAPRRLPGALSDIPTWKEFGLEAVFSNWRIVIGPKELTRAQATYWNEAFVKLTQTDEWKQHLEQNFYDGTLTSSQDTRNFLDTQHNGLKSILSELGLVK